MSVQGRLKAIKSKSPKVVAESYQEVFDNLVGEVKDAGQLGVEIEAYLTAGVVANLVSMLASLLTLFC